MVKLNKIYTRTGDDGQTVLVNGQRVAKHAKRPVAFGEVDELNSVIGIARNFADNTDIDDMLARIQNDLFDLGADLATPEMDDNVPCLRITEKQVKRIEHEIDALNENLSDLSSFILPGGSSLSQAGCTSHVLLQEGQKGRLLHFLLKSQLINLLCILLIGYQIIYLY